ncbi:hypothetical protein LCGC14_3024070, partial [marine sediment metagenome]
MIKLCVPSRFEPELLDALEPLQQGVGPLLYLINFRGIEPGLPSDPPRLPIRRSNAILQVGNLTNNR